MTPPTPSHSDTTGAGSAVLSFDVEEYFQVEAAMRSGVEPDRWSQLPKRLEFQIEQILGLLADYHTTATFFVLGWVGQQSGGLVRRIAQSGHEIASHGMSHAMLERLGPQRFRREAQDSRKLLEDLTGRPVVGFRAPTFSIREGTFWGLDVLTEAGYEYDSSIFPVRHDRYGVPDAPRWVHWAVGPAGRSILEFPPLTLRVLGHNLPAGGGGYLRLLPVRVLGYAIHRAILASQPAMIYLHPWELDPDHPDVVTGRLRRWRHRMNLHKTTGKLRYLLDNFAFTSVSDLRRCCLLNPGLQRRYGAPR